MSDVTPVKSLQDEWHWAIRISHLAHIHASVYYKQLERFLGGVLVLLSSIVSTSFFGELSQNQRLALIVGVISVSVPVIAALTAFLKPAELSEKHRKSAIGYGTLRRELEIQLARCNGDYAQRMDCLESIKTRWVELDKEAPLIPESLWRRTVRLVESKMKSKNADPESNMT